MTGMWQDFKYSLRSLGRAPLFSAIVVLSLGLGIGASTAIFTLADQLLLRSLPVKNPSQLVQLDLGGGRIGTSYGRYAFSYPHYKDFAERNTSLSGLAARYAHPSSIRVQETGEMSLAELVTGNYFEVLGVQTALGRVLSPADDRPGAPPVAVLSHRFWKERFLSDPRAVGRTIFINSQPFTVVGVSQQGFDGTDPGVAPAVRVPMSQKKVITPTWDGLNERFTHFAQLIGRLKPGVSMKQAEAELRGLRQTIAKTDLDDPFWSEAPPEAKGHYMEQTMQVFPAARGNSRLGATLEKPIQLLTAAVGLVLLIVCANVASLMLARSLFRQREVAVRFALGASRGAVMRVMIAESFLLSAAGAVLGLFISAWGCELLATQIPNELGELSISASPDLRVFAFAVLLSSLCAVLFGLMPSLRASRIDLAPALKSQSNNSSAGAGHVVLRKLLVAGQVALSLLLLIGAGLFLRSLSQLKGQNPGFDHASLIAFTVNPRMNSYTPERTIAFYRQLREKLSTVPGVQANAAGCNRVLGNDDWHASVTVEGYKAQEREKAPLYNCAGPGYFRTLGVPILTGRDFEPRDENPKHKVAIVNQEFAKKYFGGASPVGRRMAMGMTPGAPLDIEIVGLIANARYTNMRDKLEPQLFLPYEANPEEVGRLSVYVRTEGDPAAASNRILEAVRELDASLPVYAMRTIDEQMDQTMNVERMIAWLTSVFSITATLLAAMGLYGVLAFLVVRRFREFGIRVAMGAKGSDVVRLVLREVAPLIGGGAAAGLLAALALTRFVQSYLYGVSPSDPEAILFAALALGAASGIAALFPALRAARIDPMRALRYE